MCCPPEQNRPAESSTLFFFLFSLFYIFMKSTRSSCSYTSLPSLYYAHQSDIELWSLPRFCEVTFWSLSSMAFYFFELLYITQKWQCLANPKVSQSAFKAPSNLSQMALSPFYRCKYGGRKAKCLPWVHSQTLCKAVQYPQSTVFLNCEESLPPSLLIFPHYS